MVYILETEITEKKSIFFSLTQIFGINRYQSSFICKKLGFSTNCTLFLLLPDQILRLVKFVENLDFLINNNLKKSKILLLKHLILIKAYRGIRKLRGLPVRGQRTHTNAKTASKKMFN